MKKIWYPDWKGNVDDEVNTAFIQEVVDRVKSKQRLREDPNSKSEILDVDYDRQLITDCTKAYFRNIHKQFLEHHDDDKAQATKTRRKAAEAFGKESGHPGVLSEDTLKRRRDAF